MGIVFLKKYIDENKLRGKTLEDTITNVLESLAWEKYNTDESLLVKTELISAATTVLFAVNKINNPERLFQALVDAFRRRGYCIFSRNVIFAFIKLQNELIDLGKLETAKKILNDSPNLAIRGLLSPKMPKEYIKQRLFEQFDFLLKQHIMYYDYALFEKGIQLSMFAYINNKTINERDIHELLIRYIIPYESLHYSKITKQLSKVFNKNIFNLEFLINLNTGIESINLAIGENIVKYHLNENNREYILSKINDITRQAILNKDMPKRNRFVINYEQKKGRGPRTKIIRTEIRTPLRMH